MQRFVLLLLVLALVLQRPWLLSWLTDQRRQLVVSFWLQLLLPRLLASVSVLPMLIHAA
jgi:hypothetical protein